MKQASRFIVLLLVASAMGGCTCLIPMPGTLAPRTNHTYQTSIPAMGSDHAYRVEGELLELRVKKRWPMSIANTAPCDVQYRASIAIHEHTLGQDDLISLDLCYRERDWISASKWLYQPGIYDLAVGDRVIIAYNRNRLGSVVDIVAAPVNPPD